MNRKISLISLVIFSAGCFLSRSGYRSSEELSQTDVPTLPTDAQDNDVPDPDPMDVPDDEPDPPVDDVPDPPRPDAGPVTAPRLIAPLSSSRVTSRRVTVTLEAPAAMAARVEFSENRAFRPMNMVPAPVGFAQRQTQFLAPMTDDGIVYIRACVGASECSAIWTLQITKTGPDPGAAAAASKGWGVSGNVLGGAMANRMSEVVLSGRNGDWHEGLVYFYSIANLGLSQQPAFVWDECRNLLNAGADCAMANARGHLLGTELTMLGDMNGDGRAEVGAFGNPLDDGGELQILSYQGGNITHVGGPARNPLRNMVRNLTAVSDVNGDGLTDVAIVVRNNNVQVIDLFLAALPMLPTGNPLSSARRVTLADPALVGTAAANFGNSITGAGDINGDGYADIAVGVPELAPNGQVWIFYGRPTNAMAPILGPDVRINGTAEFTGLGQSIIGGGDFDGDQFADLIATYSDGPNHGYVFIRGGAMPQLVNGSALGNLDTLDELAAAGDLNDDGRGDVVLAEHRAGALPVRLALLFVEPDNRMMMMPAHVGNRVFQTIMGAQDLADISVPGDINGDGVDDVVLSTTNQPVRLLRFDEGPGQYVPALGMGGVVTPAPAPRDFAREIAWLNVSRWRARATGSWPMQWASSALSSRYN